MKNIKFFLLLFIGLSLAVSSCKKADDKAAEDVINQIMDVKGSINIVVNGNTYNNLFSSVVYSSSEKSVSFWAYDLDSQEDSFIVAFAEVPEVGATGIIDPESDNTMSFIITGSFNGTGGYFGTSVTITRVSTDKYELDIQIASLEDESDVMHLTGNVVVGENN